MKLLLIIFSFFDFFQTKSKSDIKYLQTSIVNIEVHSFQYSYEIPWNPPNIRSSGGSGFIIAINNKKYILTNAHVVSSAFQIRVKRQGQYQFFYAKVLYIAHDCDLALLDIDDKLNPPDVFYKDVIPLEIGDVPELNSPVYVIGFPIGGEKISITQGIVSRIDMDTYSHSGVDSHLVIQVDAAINPGNSGGPAIQNGKVIGVAFQILRSGENLGYLIPPPVIKKFLKDITIDGKYDGYIELGILYQTTENVMMKKILELPEEYKNHGVYIYDILPDASAEGWIKKGDILIEIQGYKVKDTGDIFYKGEYINLIEIIDNLEQGELIRVKVLRNKEIKDLVFPAKITRMLDFQRKNYDHPPEFILYGGLLFQPLTSDLMSNYSSIWLERNRSEILFYYFYAIQNRTTLNNRQKIILTKTLLNSIKNYAKTFEHSIVSKINGKDVYNMYQFLKLLQEIQRNNSTLILEFEGKKMPLVLEIDKLKEIHKQIIRQYNLKNYYYLDQKYEK